MLKEKGIEKQLSTVAGTTAGKVFDAGSTVTQLSTDAQWARGRERFNIVRWILQAPLLLVELSNTRQWRVRTGDVTVRRACGVQGSCVGTVAWAQRARSWAVKESGELTRLQ